MVTTISNDTKLVAVFTQCGHIQVGWYMHTAPLQLSCLGSPRQLSDGQYPHFHQVLTALIILREVINNKKAYNQDLI